MKICPLLRVACDESSPGTELFWNCEKPVTMPLTDSLPNGPASKVAGGSHCSGPVRTNVESGAGGCSAAAAGVAAGSCAPGACAGVAGVAAEACSGAEVGVGVADVCAIAVMETVRAVLAIASKKRFRCSWIVTVPPVVRWFLVGRGKRSQTAETEVARGNVRTRFRLQTRCVRVL